MTCDLRDKNLQCLPGQGIWKRRWLVERDRTWNVQVSKAIASSASHHVGPTARALDISNPAPCARGCTAEGGYSCEERGTWVLKKQTPALTTPWKMRTTCLPDYFS